MVSLLSKNRHWKEQTKFFRYNEKNRKSYKPTLRNYEDIKSPKQPRANNTTCYFYIRLTERFKGQVSIYIDESNELYGSSSIIQQYKTRKVIGYSRKSIQICKNCFQEIYKGNH